MSVLGDERLESLLARLHAESEGQGEAMNAWFGQLARTEGRISFEDDPRVPAFLADKLVALEKDKAEFCYLLCRSLRAARVVEAGTSFGVSTIYLAAAVRANGGGVVIGAEHEPAKAAAARSNFQAAGLSDLIDLREGDLRETLKDVGGPVDFMLVDIWTPMAAPALALVAPHLRPGAIVVCDNTANPYNDYKAYFAFIADPANGLTTMTLPFDGGLELTVKG